MRFGITTVRPTTLGEETRGKRKGLMAESKVPVLGVCAVCGGVYALRQLSHRRQLIEAHPLSADPEDWCDGCDMPPRNLISIPMTTRHTTRIGVDY